MTAATTLKHGNEFPFDMKDDETIPPATDWAHRAARGVIADLQGRRGVKSGFYDIDEDTREELVQSVAEIIRVAKQEDTK